MTAGRATTAGRTGAAADRLLPVAVAVPVALVGGACSAVQGVVNGGLAERVGTPVVAALVSNGLATVLLLAAALAFRPVRVGLGRLRGSGLRWWQYLGGVCGALFVAGSALTVPVLGVALVTVVQVCGTSVGGVVTDRLGLGPTGRLPISPVRLGSAVLAVVAVGIAQLGRPVGDVAVGLLGFVLLLGLGLSVQSALNGRVTQTARNVGSASLVNALVGTSALSLAAGAFAAAGHLHPHAAGGPWWLYLGGVLSLVVTGANLAAVRTLGVLRTGLAVIAGQLVGGLLLDTFVPGQHRPTPAVVVGAALTVAAVLLSGLATGGRPRRRTAPAGGADS
ncbi:DMT family transporter [Actinocatenispora rupis]|uniref:Membrane protein n=1 Tax=Actinocatenispora rupis TaxID=519421 RepID=A0A8J3J2Y8_9ACTN|nr:DMT family transporter [Actinocatenispora rupis]GID11140.1 membrane protein [Actinocatenispora rupis]